MVSPVWSPHTATIEHTCALAKQWRQTVRIETIAGQLGTPGRARHRSETRPAEDRQRDRTEGAKAACERCGYLEGCQVARDWGRSRIGRGLAEMRRRLRCRRRGHHWRA